MPRTASEIAAAAIDRINAAREQCLPIPLLDLVDDAAEFMTVSAAALVAAGLATETTPAPTPADPK